MIELTQRQENFTRNIFKGMTQRAAYIEAYHPKSAIEIIDVDASRLLSNAKVKARLKELNESADDKTIASVVERKQVLTEIIRGRFAEFMTHLTAEKLRSAALQEIRIIEFVGGPPGKDGEPRAKEKTTTIKLHNPIQAIAELNKMERIYEAGDSVIIDNRVLHINVISPEAKELTERLIAGERTGEESDTETGHNGDNEA